MDIVCILGRQPELSLAELEQRFGADSLRPFSDISGVVTTSNFNIQTLGGVQKAGRVIVELDKTDWPRLSRDIVQRYAKELKGSGKLTLGISVYGHDVAARDVQRTGLALKAALKKHGRSVRLIPNDAPALSNATSHHNKLGLAPNKLELMVIYGPKSVLVAESLGAQNITALAARDQARPKTDAFVGMLPPKLALMMINMSGMTSESRLVGSSFSEDSAFPAGASQERQPDQLAASGSLKNRATNQNGDAQKPRVLDPFCGTGVVLQEAALLGFAVYGTDLSDKMIDYTKANLEWLTQKHPVESLVEQGDATEHKWLRSRTIAAVVAETYLGQPFSAPPSQDKLDKVVTVVDQITTKFLKNIHNQLSVGTPLCLAVPAWKSATGWFTYLPVIKKLELLGYEWQTLSHVDSQKLTYHREDQVVARQLLLLKTK